MQNPPILTVTGTRRPHDRAGRISLLHRIHRHCGDRFGIRARTTVTVYRVWCNWRKRFGVCGARNRQTNGKHAEHRPRAPVPLAACRSGRVWYSVCLFRSCARSEAFRLKSGLFINNRQTIRKPFEC
jgi:hypothetical protein